MINPEESNLEYYWKKSKEAMELRNNKQYIDFLTNRESIEFLGVREDPKQQDPLLRAFAGEVTSLTHYLSTVTNFATDSVLQVFYEFMQNANDAGGSRIAFYFDEENFIAINNGSPIYTDAFESNRKGQLKSFLRRQAGEKFEDPASIGRFGQGSKLMYDLLISQQKEGQSLVATRESALQTSLMHECSGPILFSWSKLDHLESLLRLSDAATHTRDCNDDQYPLLTKIIYTYYPSLLNEEITLYSGDRRILFNKEELNECINFLVGIESKLKHFEYKQGSLFYIRLGQGQYERLKEVVQGGLKEGVSASLAFLPMLQEVDIQAEVIKKAGIRILDIPSVQGDIKITLALPKDPKEASPRLSNFYKFFPITETKFGLNFIINCLEYEIDASRQRIDFSNPRNEQIMELIGTSIAERTLQFAQQPDYESLNAIIKSIAAVNDEALNSSDVRIRKLIYTTIKETVATCLPVQGGGVRSAPEVRIKDTALAVIPAELGFEWRWLTDELEDYYTHVEKSFNLAYVDIIDLFSTCSDRNLLDSWVIRLSSDEYSILINEIYEYSETTNIKNWPFVRFSDGSVYTFKEIEQNENLIFLTPGLEKLGPIFSDRGLAYAGVEFLDCQKFHEWIGPLYSFRKEAYIRRFISLISQLDLSRAEKKIVYEVFKNFNEASKLLKNELLLFTNKKGEKKPLCKLLPNTSSIAPSGILDPYCIKASEVIQDSEMTTFMMKEGNIWNHLLEDWTIIRPEEMDISLFKSLVRDLDTLFNKSSDPSRERFDNDLKWIYISDDNWVSIDSIFYSKNLSSLKLQETAYVKFIGQLLEYSSLTPVPYTYLELFDDISFANFPRSGLRALEDSMAVDAISVDADVIEKLYAIKLSNQNFFSYFLISEAGEGSDRPYLLSLSNGNSYQYYSRDARLNEFLEDKRNYYLLPADLQRIFSDDNLLWEENDNFADDLIIQFGPQQSFYDLVNRQSDRVKTNYLNSLTTVNGGLHLNAASVTKEDKPLFEERVLEMIGTRNEWKSRYRDRIYIHGRPLADYQYHDIVTIKVTDEKQNFTFSLADLIPSFRGLSDVYETVKEFFPSIQEIISSQNSYNADHIPEKIGSAVNTEQLAFLICYYESKKNTQTYDSGFISRLNLSHIQNNELLNKLYVKKIYFFADYLSGYNSHFNLKNYILTSKNNLILGSEVLQQWIMDWMNTSETNEKKVFLVQAGLNNDDSAVISVRTSLYEQKEVKIEQIEDLVSQRQPLVENTMLWAAEQLAWPQEQGKATKALHRLMSYYCKKQDALLPYFLFFVRNDSGEIKLELRKIEGRPYNCWYIKSLDSESQKIFIKNIPAGHSIVDLITNYYDDRYETKLKELGIQECTIESEVTAADKSNQYKEWDNAAYRNWRQHEGAKYSVMLSDNPLPVLYKCRFSDGTEKELGSANIGKVHRVALNDGTYQLYLYRQNPQTKIIDLLLEHRDELFGKDSDVLFSLLQAADLYHFSSPITADDYNLLDTNLDLIKGLFQNVSQDILKKLNDSDETRELLDTIADRNDKASISALLDKADEESLEWLLDNWDTVMGMRETTANELIGYMGERLIYQFIKMNIDGNRASIKDVSATEPSYDLLLTLGETRRYIEVKTTIKSIYEADGSVPLYLRSSQRERIKKTTSTGEDYLLARISLKDVMLGDEYEQYRSVWLNNNKNLDESLKTYIDDSISRYLNIEENIQRVQDNLILLSIKSPSFSWGLELLFD